MVAVRLKKKKTNNFLCDYDKFELWESQAAKSVFLGTASLKYAPTNWEFIRKANLLPNRIYIFKRTND